MKRSIVFRLARAVAMGLLLGGLVFLCRMDAIAENRLLEVRKRVEPGLKNELQSAGLRYGAPVFLRVFKESAELELWIESKAGAEGEWKRFQTWRIANHSGGLGPKLREGDLQAPEGFYLVTASQLNPQSRFHLSFNLGYPNAYDRHHGRTGSLIMVHGSNVSIGCFAMTDPVIEVIYLLVEAALRAGQDAVPVHCFPFRMTPERLERAHVEAAPWLSFWRDELLPIDAAFEKVRRPPRVKVEKGRYRLTGGG